MTQWKSFFNTVLCLPKQWFFEEFLYPPASDDSYDNYELTTTFRLTTNDCWMWCGEMGERRCGWWWWEGNDWVSPCKEQIMQRMGAVANYVIEWVWNNNSYFHSHSSTNILHSREKSVHIGKSSFLVSFGKFSNSAIKWVWGKLE